LSEVLAQEEPGYHEFVTLLRAGTSVFDDGAWVIVPLWYGQDNAWKQ
jgi:hypothetical protein